MFSHIELLSTWNAGLNDFAKKEPWLPAVKNWLAFVLSCDPKMQPQVRFLLNHESENNAILHIEIADFCCSEIEVIATLTVARDGVVKTRSAIRAV